MSFFAAMVSMSTLAIGLPSCGKEAGASSAPPVGKRVLLIGMDGMDPKLLQDLMDAGKMPHFVELAKRGGFTPLETSTPPQSPVAWSNFITGGTAGVHNIFDFIHRRCNADRKMLYVEPFLSTTEQVGEEKFIDVPYTRYRVPTTVPETTLLRRGRAFWRDLLDHNIETTIFRVPANYPSDDPHSPHFTALTGMGTPDMRGSYGEFFLFTSRTPRDVHKISGGLICRLDTRGDVATGELIGPANVLIKPTVKNGSSPEMKIPFTITRDPSHPVAKLNIQGQEVLLNKGEWTDWMRVTFDIEFPILKYFESPTAIVRFLLAQTHPRIELYASPINIDPENPAQEISIPHEYAERLAHVSGPYYTQGIPEQYNALKAEKITDEQYLQQTEKVMAERLVHYDYTLKNFEDGFCFFYFGATDQLAHMMWRATDPEHPLYTEELGEKHGDVIEKVYLQMDDVLAKAMDRLNDDDTLMIMSDHGFASFRRGFHLNSWLREQGYLTLMDDDGEAALLSENVDWRRTKAYSLGINSLFLNLRNRERSGIVTPGKEADAVMVEIIAKLKSVKDPKDGKQVIVEVYRGDDIYPEADPTIRPDLFVGYGWGYRSSWETALGGMPEGDLVVDNTNKWSGDHCIATHLVPGVFLSNKRITKENPTLSDVAPTILKEFGIEPPEQMTGKPIF